MAINKNFVVKHGLEVNDDLILANADTSKVGIATTNPQYNLHVNGGIGVTNAYISGIATVKTNLVLNGLLTANASAGSTGQYLKSTSTGVEWASFPSLRTSTSFIATTGQTTFSFAYTVGLLDVYVNGVKLASTEFTASDGVSVVLTNPCFGGEFIEIIGYAVNSVGAGVSGIAGLTIQDEGSIIGNTGGVTSINFVGAGITSVGTGAGITVYVTDTGGGYWETTAAGIHTLSNVGIGTTNPTSALTVTGSALITGLSTFSDTLAVLNQSAVAVLTVGHDVDGTGTDHLGIYYNNILGTPGIGGTASIFTSNGDLRFDVNDGTSNIIFGNGVSDHFIINGTTGNIGIATTNPVYTLDVAGYAQIRDGLSVSGVTSSTSFYGDASYVVDGKWTLGANGTSDYTFVGIGFTQTTNDPVLYLARGRVYEFVNNSGGSHPFEIRVSNGGSAYNDGVTNNGAATGTIRFEIPMNAPNTLYYQCTNHAGMGNTISVYPSLI